MGHSLGAMQMICKNPDCINKSIVYRKMSHPDSFECKKCGQILSKVQSYRALKQDEKAKQDLMRLGLL